jgi:RNA polymerase sigma-70 factor (TIGR02943 family)
MQEHTLNCNNWIEKYTDYLYSYAFYKIGKKEEAEDLVQDTFLSAFKGKEAYNGIASEKTWLLAILKNKIIDYYRKPKNTDSFSTYIDETADSFDNSFFDETNSGRWKKDIEENYFSNAAESYLLGKEFQRFLQICIDKMPSKLKAVFISKYIDDEKTEHICAAFNITPANYWVIIFRSKTLLRTCLENKGLLN